MFKWTKLAIHGEHVFGCLPCIMFQDGVFALLSDATKRRSPSKDKVGTIKKQICTFKGYEILVS